MRLAPSVYIYIAYFKACLEPGLCAKYTALLSAEEIARRDRLAMPVLRDRYLVSHALVRCALSRHARISPHAWRFSKSMYGKPFVCDSHGDAAGLRFNLSHNDNLAAVAVCDGREIGIDVESLDQSVELLDSPLVLSDAERMFLQLAPQESRLRYFLEHWTLKEAYLKAAGTGLSTPLPGVELDLSRAGIIGASFAPTLADAPDRWAYFQYRIEPDIIMSLCVERRREAEQMDVQVSHMIPLEEVKPLPNVAHRQG